MNTKLLRDVIARGAMTRGVITASINEKCKNIAKLLSEKEISGICIIGDDGKAVGVISEMDILKVIGMENWENMRAESIMTSNLERLNPTLHLLKQQK